MFVEWRTGWVLALPVITGLAIWDWSARPLTLVSAADAGNSGALCTASMQMDWPDLCPETGPAVLRADYWETGLLPSRQFPSRPIAESLGTLDRSYAVVSKDRSLPLYRTVADAAGNNPDHFMEKGFVYISFTDVIVRDNEKYLITGNGWVVRRDDATPTTTHYRQFHGVELAEHPRHAFGWVVPYAGVYPSIEPGALPDQTRPFHEWYSFVEVFETRVVNDAKWHMIGFGQWVPASRVGLVVPEVSIPEGIPPGAKWFSINLEEQSFAAYEGDRLVFATLASTGVYGFWTRPGVYTVKKKWEYQSMSGAFEADRSDFYFVQDVPYILYYDGTRAIHGSYWHNNFGYEHSHGCINLPVADAHWAFDWAGEEAWVHVFDPSGKTPTGADFYKNESAAP